MEFIKIIAEVVEFCFEMADCITRENRERKSKDEKQKEEKSNQEKNNFVEKEPLVKIFDIVEYKGFDTVKAIMNEVISGNIAIVKMNKMDEQQKEEAKKLFYGMCYGFEINPELIDEDNIVIDPNHKTVRIKPKIVPNGNGNIN